MVICGIVNNESINKTTLTKRMTENDGNKDPKPSCDIRVSYIASIISKQITRKMPSHVTPA